MEKRIKQIFLFLIPTLAVALVFIPLSQQNFVISDDVDSNAVNFATDAPSKNLNHGFVAQTFCVLFLGVERFLPTLLAVGSIFIFLTLLNQREIRCLARNRAPPLVVC